MKALSLFQPWASLVVMGHKKIETRSWYTHYRGPLLIHASANRSLENWRIACAEPFKQYMPQYDSLFICGEEKAVETNTDWRALPFGAIIGSVNLVDIKATSMFPKWIKGLTDQELAFGNYYPGRYAWLLSDPVMFDEPIPCKGNLGIWNLPASLEKERYRALNPEALHDPPTLRQR